MCASRARGYGHLSVLAVGGHHGVLEGRGAVYSESHFHSIDYEGLDSIDDTGSRWAECWQVAAINRHQIGGRHGQCTVQIGHPLSIGIFHPYQPINRAGNRTCHLRAPVSGRGLLQAHKLTSSHATLRTCTLAHSRTLTSIATTARSFSHSPLTSRCSPLAAHYAPALQLVIVRSAAPLTLSRAPTRSLRSLTYSPCPSTSPTAPTKRATSPAAWRAAKPTSRRLLLARRLELRVSRSSLSSLCPVASYLSTLTALVRQAESVILHPSVSPVPSPPLSAWRSLKLSCHTYPLARRPYGAFPSPPRPSLSCSLLPSPAVSSPPPQSPPLPPFSFALLPSPPLLFAPRLPRSLNTSTQALTAPTPPTTPRLRPLGQLR